MNYEFILNDLRPSQEEIDAVNKTTEKVISFLNKTCKEENIPAQAFAVGSVAKNTWLSGKSDIDIFIRFPLKTDEAVLKEKGLYLGYKTNDALKGKASEHYASHPYLTCLIDGIEVDIVPCYWIEDGSQLKSAVDRTILHTRYIQKHLKKSQEDEVLLLKKFMDAVGTYGSEFKTGGFAGYLCELLILKYSTFEETLRQAQDWKFHTKIDLENYGTSDNKLFKNDPLVFIDPTDKNRNVAAALRIERMLDFIIASRNYINLIDSLEDADENIIKEKVLKYFSPLLKERFQDKSVKEISDDILDEFKDRETQTLVISFPIPEMNADALHPQLLKTVESISHKLESEDFSVYSYDYWTDEKNLVIFIIELNVFKQSKYYVHEGPKVWNKLAFNNFSAKWSQESLYHKGEFIVFDRERQFVTAKELVKHLLEKDNIHEIKVGKNLRKAISSTHTLCEIDEFLENIDQFICDEADQREFLNTLDDLLRPGQYLKR
ncbi:tRNA nucleotidyltransferase Cca [Methanobrevibacter ruminantium M1]|uniref:CCA-adding enzyme n=1 Tax=Methanobrevibacter ruminantium (strain ATCC 35063 / DSM 1093 / JCM 13430 / OCM 146 / M1) TaxID=634498 RepID=D3E2S7_METRM|nr:CCA tRNA nucleotidyltransferase [Methanobrevibacter ruminantium]ADC46838.1 tRNA nucleotidyltransferase Cca [Methanobrevibacter ruminantium M1]